MALEKVQYSTVKYFFILFQNTNVINSLYNYQVKISSLQKTTLKLPMYQVKRHYYCYYFIDKIVEKLFYFLTPTSQILRLL